MRKVKAATIAAMVLACLAVSTWNATPSHAQAYTETIKEQVPLPFDSFYVPCGNGGDGENVLLDGYLESTTQVTIDNNGVMLLVFNLLPQVTAEGETSGATYNCVGHSQQTVKVQTDGSYSYTYTDNFVLVGQGQAADLYVKTTQRVIVYADGSYYIVVDKWEVTRCK